MCRSFAVSLAALCLISNGMPRESAPPRPETWFVDSLIKVHPSEASVEGMRDAEFIGARNQHINLQVAIRSSEPLLDLRSEAKPLRGRSGHRIAMLCANWRAVTARWCLIAPEKNLSYSDRRPQ